MLTPRQVQIARRLHHQSKHAPPRQKLEVAAADVQAVLAGLWFLLDEADRLAGKNRELLIERAERRAQSWQPATGA